MARVESDRPALAATVHNAVHAEYNYFVKEVRGFSQIEIICEAPDYFTSLARCLGGYLKAVEFAGDPLDWRNALGDHLSYGLGDYFTFTDKVDGVLCHLQRHYEQEQMEQDNILGLLKSAGWHPSLLKDTGETDSDDDESGVVPPA